MGARGANYKFPAPRNLEGGKKKKEIQSKEEKNINSPQNPTQPA